MYIHNFVMNAPEISQRNFNVFFMRALQNSNINYPPISLFSKIFKCTLLFMLKISVMLKPKHEVSEDHDQ